MYRLVGCALKFRTRSRARPWTAGLQTPRQPEVPIPTFESNSRNTVSGLTLLPSPNRGRVRAKRGGRTETAASLSCADPQKGNGLVWRGQKRGRGAYRCRTTTQPCRLPDAPERIRTSTTYSGHQALNLVTHGPETIKSPIAAMFLRRPTERKQIARHLLSRLLSRRAIRSVAVSGVAEQVSSRSHGPWVSV